MMYDNPTDFEGDVGFFAPAEIPQDQPSSSSISMDPVVSPTPARGQPLRLPILSHPLLPPTTTTMGASIATHPFAVTNASGPPMSTAAVDSPAGKTHHYPATASDPTQALRITGPSTSNPKVRPLLPIIADAAAAVKVSQAHHTTEEGEDYGDDMWEREGVLEDVDRGTLNGVTEQGMIQDDEPVATVEVMKKREDIRKNVIPNSSGIALVGLNRLHERHRAFFKFPAFNPVQSMVFDDTQVYHGDDNIVVSAPTGSGKTTIFELAILKYALDTAQSRSEVTGDTEQAKAVYQAVIRSNVIITTPEKIEAITRRGAIRNVITERVKLILIDEVHILRENRGATLEVFISRMKMNERVRFVALSATVPNIDDIARWLGPPKPPHELSHGFGEEFRPVPLSRETYGIDGGGNEWAVAGKLDKELYPILLRHSNGQAVLVFCPTRKACQATAEYIFKLYQEAKERNLKVPWVQHDTDPLDLMDSKIAELSTYGIAVHHAGLELSDRRKIEDAFRAGRLHMIVSTSTLAVGVNLPAHTVVIKGTMAWQGPQMMGRAGRPQYDTSGVVVVMCERTKVQKPKYQKMLYSQTVLESCLHENLTEHLNSEISLGNIQSVSAAQAWLRKDGAKDWEEFLNNHVEMCSIQDGMSPRATVRDLLVILSGATEFRDLRIRRGEISTLNKIRAHPELRYPLKDSPKDYP
ncbi:hypothetical protein IAR55_001903 [Kwoniella newhampshirensis]|uniref:Uncharacterized protein n=1 Tax=Kwoniella newhampshirensis TaxID=1651941 RepID=A0AAW0Z3E9_9TREE